MGRLPTDEIEELIIKSVRESSLFRNEWERLFISTVFQMFMEKGDFVHFVDTYPFDRIDYEWYFRDLIIPLIGEEDYLRIGNETFDEGGKDGE